MPNSKKTQILLTPATLEDCQKLWEWRNDPQTREASFNSHNISYEEHERWFNLKIADPCTRIFIARDSQGNELGYVRFHIRGEEGEISVGVDKDYREKGYGVLAIKDGSNLLLDTQTVQRIVAHIKYGNRKAMNSFKRAGYSLRGYKEVASMKAYEMIYEHCM
jgi:UDP-2,4-diacetamido-2,4,6-trideoxy-beta-L-altropyranose hydrolase